MKQKSNKLEKPLPKGKYGDKKKGNNAEVEEDLSESESDTDFSGEELEDESESYESEDELSGEDSEEEEIESEDDDDIKSKIQKTSTDDKKHKTSLRKLKGSENESFESELEEEEDDDEDGEAIGSDDEDGKKPNKTKKYSTGKDHKRSLQKLKECDPEFYQFLEENDKKLLQFDVSDSESEPSDSEDSEIESVHVPPEKLEGASDESDYEPEEGIHTIHGADKVITLQMVEDWQKNLQSDKSVATISEVVKAFHAAVLRVSVDDDAEASEYKVAGSSVFNAVIRLCVVDLQSSLRKLLKLSPEATHFQPSKCKKWKKIKTLLKGYLTDLLKLLSTVTSEHILTVLLKHNHQMIIFWSAYSTLKKSLVKHLVHLWSKSEDDTVRILSFLCILRINASKTIQQEEDTGTKIYEISIKMMYLAYVQNTKFVSPSTLPAINFMRQSLSELYALNDSAAYPHVFMYIRQLAIHLRNALTISKKENLQTVYNWQFINSLHLWCKLLSSTSEKSPLRPLLYPLIQVAIGTVKLIPTSQYYPLRFHVLKMLSELSAHTGVFIPILPFLIEVLNFDFNKKHTKVSMKPMSFDCVLRLSKVQMQENGFKDAVIDSLYDMLFDYLASESHRIGFPDLVVPLCMELKKFLKTCKVANYCKKMKQVLEKVEENVKTIEKQRKVSFQINDHEAVTAWETNIKNQGTPLSQFYETWNKLNKQKAAKRATENDKDDYDLPVIKKFKKTVDTSKPSGPVELFPSSDESDVEINFGNFEEEEEKPKNKKLKKKATKQENSVKDDLPVKSIKVEIDDADMNGTADIIEDLNISEYE